MEQRIMNSTNLLIVIRADEMGLIRNSNREF